MNAAAAFGWRNLLSYGLLGLPLAFAALPLYVILPNHYAREFGMPLATLGALLLGARLLDAAIDPWLGRWADRLLARSPGALLRVAGAAALLLVAALALLFLPPQRVVAAAQEGLLLWAALMLMLTYLGYSFLSISHQAWGALMGGSETERSRLTGWREACALVGVLTASVLPSVFGLPVTLSVLTGMMALAWLAWSRSLRPVLSPTVQTLASLWMPLRQRDFQRLLGVFVLNGVASAVPATLVLFFVQDRLQAPARLEPLFLGAYFLSAALSMPLWLALVRRWGLARSWQAGMLLAVAVFVWASRLGAGEAWAFVAVCALSGLALGADLALPSALLAGLLQRHPGGERLAGAFFGWWNLATKLNLALAAGLALPLLQWFGYAPGVRSEEGLTALVVAYCLLPCALKLAAALALQIWIIRPSSMFKESLS
jgi:Na+/melibiose symporter-like transporter